MIKNNYALAPTYADGSTAFNCHIISVVFFSSSNKLQSMLVDYAVTDMGCFDDSLDAAPHAKTMRGGGNNNFLLYVAPCIIFNQKYCYSNTYFRGTVEVIIFKVKFQGY